MIENACYDIKDERAYKYSKVFENELLGAENYVSQCILDNVEYQNQWLEKVTKMMCVFYATGHWSNEENFQEWSEVRIENKKLWLEAEKLWRLDVTKGALVEDWPKTARDLWYIKGWAEIDSIQEAKHSIINKRPIVVGSNRIKWSLGYKSPFVLWGDKGSWHAILLIGFDDNYEWGCFIFKNSYWDERYDWGKMYLKYSDFHLLFRWKFSLIDQEDPILQYKKNIMSKINIPMARVGFDLWIWNGEDAGKTISREESVTVALRIAEKVLNWEITKEILSEAISKYKA